MDVSAVRGEFALLGREANGRKLVYLDNAATAQVPACVVRSVTEHLCEHNANIHRGAHMLGEEATQAFEDAREQVARFLRAPAGSSVIFTSGTTAAINLVARGLASRLGPGAALLVTELEHHSNYLPWQQLALERGAELRVCGLDERGEVDAAQWKQLLADGRVALAAVTACSNVTGGVTQLDELLGAAREVGALTLVDGAQAARARLLNASELAACGCDFIALSGHKMCAPTGIGALWGRDEALELLQPAAFGGGMVDEVGRTDARFSALPERLEAGTPNICGAVALGEACRYLDALGLDELRQREMALTQRAEELLRKLPGVRVLGSPRQRCGAVSFEVEGLSSYDIARLLDAQGVAVRSGHHCAIPAMRALGADTAVRVSPAFYNTEEELEACAAACAKAIEMLGRY